MERSGAIRTNTGFDYADRDDDVQLYSLNRVYKF